MRILRKLNEIPYEYKILFVGTLLAIIINVTAR